MKNGRELKMGKKYECISTDRKRILMVHNVTEEDTGIYECVLNEDRMSLQLSLKGTTEQSKDQEKRLTSTPVVICHARKKKPLQ